MQSKHQIQDLLSSAGVSINKRLGQHFLIDLNLMQLLVSLAEITANDIVLETGCGTGSLTEELAEQAGKVIAVEIDRTLANITKRQLAESEKVEVIHCDVLESKNTINHQVIRAVEQGCKEYCGRFLLVSNFPYSVAATVMLSLVSGPTTADAMYITVQREVGQRMTASSGNKNYGILSILLEATGKVRMERILKPTVFWPEPQVDSAMVSFVRSREKAARIHNMELLREVVNLFMGYRRKMLKACTKLAQGRLAEIKNWPQIFELCSVDPHKRPETLSTEDYIAIANLCGEYLNLK